MPYVMVGVYGIMCIMTLVYGIYSYVEKKDKKKIINKYYMFYKYYFCRFFSKWAFKQ